MATFNGTQGNDTLTGSDTNDTLNGFDGNNVLNGLMEDDLIYGFLGNDTLYAQAGADTLWGGGENDSLDGGDGNDSLDGGSGNDTLNGGSGNNFMQGWIGNDVFLSYGTDTLMGGAGSDIYWITNSNTVVDETEPGSDGFDRIVTSVTYTLPSNVEELYLDATTAAAINGIGNNQNNVISGTQGNDRLFGMGGNDSIVGLGGNDTLNGGVGDDRLDGGAGDDRLEVSPGNDTLIGGDGVDTAVATIGQYYILDNDRLEFYVPGLGGSSQLFRQSLVGIEAAHLTVQDTGVPQSINASAFTGKATLIGSQSNDTLIGGSGNDTLNGGAGTNLLNGGAGFDTVQVTGLSNLSYVYGALIGNDSRNFYNATNQLNQIEAVEVIGTDGNDYLNLSALPDTITSSIQGGNGNDTLVGGLKSTLLDGGAGNDTAEFNLDNRNFRLTDTRLATINNDVIVNLSSIETVKITGGNGNNAMNGSASTQALYLIGGAGDDTLRGGSGNDTLDGGMGTNYIYGGAGIDTFKSSGSYEGLQVIYGFDRATEKLDFSDTDGRKYLSSKDIRITREGNDSIVSVGDKQIFKVVDSLVDSRNFIGLKDPTLSNFSLSTNARSDVGILIRDWARAYAEYRSTPGKTVTFKDSPATPGGTDPLLNTVKFTVGELKFANTRPIDQPEFAGSGTSTVRTTAGGAVGFTYQFSEADITQTTVSNAFKIGTKVGGKVSKTWNKAPGGVGSTVTLEGNFEVNFDYTRTTATTEGRSTTQSFTQTSTVNLLPSSVSTVEGGAVMFRETSDFSTNVAVEGSIKLSFDGISDVDVPIAAILQSYMPEVFRGSGRVIETTLTAEGDPGTFLSYYSDTSFTQSGTIDLMPFVRQDVRVTSEIQDDDLTNPALRAYGTKPNEVGSYAERFWVARGDIPNRGSVVGANSALVPVTLELTGFNRFEDKIGVASPGITHYADLKETAIQVAVQGTSLDGKTTTSLVDSTRISFGSRTLVDVVGLTPDQLDASHFVFSTKGSIFDNTLARQ